MIDQKCPLCDIILERRYSTNYSGTKKYLYYRCQKCRTLFGRSTIEPTFGKSQCQQCGCDIRLPRKKFCHRCNPLNGWIFKQQAKEREGREK